jgi:aquaporin Z
MIADEHRPQPPAAPVRSGPAPGTQACGGWHWAEWGSEFAGTGILLLGGLSGLFLNFAPGSPVAAALPGQSVRLLLTGLILGATGLLVTVSPLGRRSGAHLNPSVSLAFWRRGHMHPHDLIGYVAAQTAGAIAGTLAARWCWGTRAAALDLGVTRPGHGISTAAAAGIEALLTFILISGILLAVSSPRTARWTPLVAWGLVALLVWQGGELTGASLNPARSLAPALLAPYTAGLWAYLVGPLAGSLAAVTAYGTVSRLETRTAKLLHDPGYPSTMAATLPVAVPQCGPARAASQPAASAGGSLPSRSARCTASRASSTRDLISSLLKMCRR